MISSTPSKNDERRRDREREGKKLLFYVNMDKVLRNNHAKRAGLGAGLERVFLPEVRGDWGIGKKGGRGGIIYMETIYIFFRSAFTHHPMGLCKCVCGCVWS